MKVLTLLFSTVILFFCSFAAAAQNAPPAVNLAPNAPPDRSIGMQKEEVARFEAAIKPYVEQARGTYPQARTRFLKGLPPHESFLITTRLHDSAGRFEQVFIAVKTIKDGTITGVIASEIDVVSGYHAGDPFTFPESEIYDWTITKPDGSEEGNVVGKFLDTYRPQSESIPTTWLNRPATPAHIQQHIEETTAKYQSQGPFPRVVFFDIAYPRDNDELNALDGHAVLLLTGLSQVKEELPLNRVYVSVDGKEIELNLVRQVLSDQSSASNAVTKTFGAYRVDALYLLPFYLRMRDAVLIADFGGGKAGIKAATFGGPVSDDVKTLTIRLPTGAGPAPGALDAFIKREFPGF